MYTDVEEVTIRRMEDADVDSVIAIEEKAYGDHHWSKASFLSELNNDLAYYYALITSNGDVGAYAGTWHILDEAHITNIAVNPNYRGKKYAQALLKRIIDDCHEQKIKYITLEVRVSNIPAINLYTKYGFKSFGTRKKYYQDNNEDALIMWTNNIFYDEFKNNYDRVINDLKGKINIK